MIGADEVSEKGAVKGRHMIFLFKKILGKLQDDYWSRALWLYNDLGKYDSELNDFKKAYHHYICMFFLPSNEMGNLHCNESGNFWKLENMIKNVAFLKPSESIRHIALIAT